MSPAERKLVIDRLRLVAQQWYDGTGGGSTRYDNGICYVAKYVEGSRRGEWYALMGEAFELLGMNHYVPFHGEEHGRAGDWTVRPLFCLLMADALEQME